MTIEPLYFGSNGHRLFGIYHPPHKSPAHNIGVLLCQPIGKEYILAHRALRRLAERLSLLGLHVLRFDYYGCGDSSGEFTEASVDHWISDIVAGMNELSAGCGTQQVWTVGLRLGASLAFRAASEFGNIESMVLWDPIWVGKAYTDELMQSHQQWLNGSFAKPKPIPGANLNDSGREALGFTLSKSLRTGLAELDLLDVDKKPARHVAVVESQKTNEAEVFADKLNDWGLNVAYSLVPSPSTWKKHNGNGSVIPVAILDRIAEWASQWSL